MWKFLELGADKAVGRVEFSEFLWESKGESAGRKATGEAWLMELWMEANTLGDILK